MENNEEIVYMKLEWINTGIKYFKLFDQENWKIYKEFASILTSFSIEVNVYYMTPGNEWVPVYNPSGDWS